MGPWFVPGVVEQVAEIVVSDRRWVRGVQFAPGFVHPSEVHEHRGQIVAIELAVWLQLDCLTQFGQHRFGLIVTGQAKSAIIVRHRVFRFGFQGSADTISRPCQTRPDGRTNGPG